MLPVGPNPLQLRDVVHYNGPKQALDMGMSSACSPEGKHHHSPVG